MTEVKFIAHEKALGLLEAELESVRSSKRFAFGSILLGSILLILYALYIGLSINAEIYFTMFHPLVHVFGIIGFGFWLLGMIALLKA